MDKNAILKFNSTVACMRRELSAHKDSGWGRRRTYDNDEALPLFFDLSHVKFPRLDMYGPVYPYLFQGFKMDFSTTEKEGYEDRKSPSMRVNDIAVERLVPIETSTELAVMMAELSVR